MGSFLSSLGVPDSCLSVSFRPSIENVQLVGFPVDLAALWHCNVFFSAYKSQGDNSETFRVTCDGKLFILNEISLEKWGSETARTIGEEQKEKNARGTSQKKRKRVSVFLNKENLERIITNLNLLGFYQGANNEKKDYSIIRLLVIVSKELKNESLEEIVGKMGLRGGEKSSEWRIVSRAIKGQELMRNALWLLENEG